MQDQLISRGKSVLVTRGAAMPARRYCEWVDQSSSGSIFVVHHVVVSSYYHRSFGLRAVTRIWITPRRSRQKIEIQFFRHLVIQRVVNIGYEFNSPVSTRANNRVWISSIRR